MERTDGYKSRAFSDINKCREWLRKNGLEITPNGWESKTKRGAIHFHEGEWFGAFWKK